MTICDYLGKSSKHPIYLTLGNISSWVRNKPDAKVLLGYFSRLKAKTNSQKNSRKFKFAKRSLYQYTLDVLTWPLLDYQKDGFDLQTDDGDLWCYPFLSALLEDLPEDAALTLTFNSANCKCSCHKCLIDADEMNNTNLESSQIILRTLENMKAAIYEDIADQYSLFSMENVFWKHL